MSVDRELKEGVHQDTIARYDEYRPSALKAFLLSLLEKKDRKTVSRHARQIISALQQDDPELSRVVQIATKSVDRQQPTPRILPIKGAHQKRS